MPNGLSHSQLISIQFVPMGLSSMFFMLAFVTILIEHVCSWHASPQHLLVILQIDLYWISFLSVANKAFNHETWVNDKRHTWKQWRYGHSSLAVDGNLDANLPNCAILDNYYVDQPVWMVDLGKEQTIDGVVLLTWQGAGQGKGRLQKYEET